MQLVERVVLDEQKAWQQQQAQIVREHQLLAAARAEPRRELPGLGRRDALLDKLRLGVMPAEPGPVGWSVDSRLTRVCDELQRATGHCAGFVAVGDEHVVLVAASSDAREHHGWPPLMVARPVADTAAAVVLQTAALSEASKAVVLADVRADDRLSAETLACVVGHQVSACGSVPAGVLLVGSPQPGSISPDRVAASLQTAADVLGELLSAQSNLVRSAPQTAPDQDDQTARQAARRQTHNLYAGLRLRALIRLAEDLGIPDDDIDEADSTEALLDIVSEFEFQRFRARRAELEGMSLRQLYQLLPADAADDVETKPDIVAVILEQEGLVISGLSADPAAPALNTASIPSNPV